MARIAATKVILEYAIGKPMPQVEASPGVKTIIEEDRKERARRLIAEAFKKVADENPELVGGKVSAPIEQPAAVPAASGECDRAEPRVARQPRVFALPPSPPPFRHRRRPRAGSSWAN